MRYRRDVPRDTDDAASTVEHVVAHLAGAVHPGDDPGACHQEVTVSVVDHLDGDPDVVSVIGELDAEPDACYLRDSYDPATDHPGITFRPYSEPHLGHAADHDALAAFRARKPG